MKRYDFKALIIDDDAVIVSQISELLTGYLSEIHTAENSLNGLRLLKKYDIDIVLLDVKLPDINGIDLTVKIKEYNPAIEIIIITGYSSIETGINALRSGSIDYIEKPIDIDELLVAIERAKERIYSRLNIGYPRSILIVDNDPGFIDAVKTQLESNDYFVQSATDANGAFKMLMKDRVDVFMANFNLSDMDGIQFCKRLKDICTDIAGICIFDESSKEYAVESLKAGIFNYLIMPLNYTELFFYLDRIFECLSLKKLLRFKNRELKLSNEIINKANEELERKVRERTTELNKTQTQLFQTSKLVTLGEMSAGLAHEINQPLTEILLLVHNLNNKLAADAAQIDINQLRFSLEHIKASGIRIDSIIKHIRTFARQGTLNFSLIDLNEHISLVFSGLMGNQLKSRGINVLLDLDPKLPKMYGEPYQLEQVIINLVTNARDALDEKEERVRQFNKTIEITTKFQQESESILLSVFDNGSGISIEKQKRIFEPFFTTKEVGKSTGLGLSISYGIIERHKGRIEVQSELGTGTIFNITLPIGAPSE